MTRRTKPLMEQILVNIFNRSKIKLKDKSVKN